MTSSGMILDSPSYPPLVLLWYFLQKTIWKSEKWEKKKKLTVYASTAISKIAFSSYSVNLAANINWAHCSSASTEPYWNPTVTDESLLTNCSELTRTSYFIHCPLVNWNAPTPFTSLPSLKMVWEKKSNNTLHRSNSMHAVDLFLSNGVKETTMK